MTSRAGSPPRVAERRGLTLIELLVVVVIITILATLLVPAVGRMFGAAEEKVTRATIDKIDALIKQRNIAIDQVDRSRRIAQEKILQPGLSDAAINAYIQKEMLKQAFPMTYAEAGLSVPSNHNPVTESAEILYYALVEREVIGAAGVQPTDFQAHEVADTDGDGRMEFVDAWGRPLRFYRWPTRLVRPAGPGGSVEMRAAGLLIAGTTPDMLGQDPDDPLGELLNSPRFGGDPAAFEAQYHTPDTFHRPLLVSAGADGELGLHEPHDRANFGHLAQPTSAVLSDPGNSVLNDNHSNLQRFGGN
ncbi:MAG: type II secretion system protein [Planctomycetaceae bacterium]